MGGKRWLRCVQLCIRGNTDGTVWYRWANVAEWAESVMNSIPGLVNDVRRLGVREKYASMPPYVHWENDCVALLSPLPDRDLNALHTRCIHPCTVMRYRFSIVAYTPAVKHPTCEPYVQLGRTFSQQSRTLK